jgi:hypothetical protein
MLTCTGLLSQNYSTVLGENAKFTDSLGTTHNSSQLREPSTRPEHAKIIRNHGKLAKTTIANHKGSTDKQMRRVGRERKRGKGVHG